LHSHQPPALESENFWRIACWRNLTLLRPWWLVEPDMRTQSAMFFGLLAHMEGEPIKRIIHQHLGGEGGVVDPLAALKDSPALQAAVERTLEKAKWRTSGHQAHKRPAKTVAAEVEVD
jgi:hypothetical protein